MAGNKPYSEDVYRRLELVQKQFKSNSDTQKKQAAAERRRRLWSWIASQRTPIIRYAVYGVLAALAIVMIVVAVRGSL